MGIKSSHDSSFATEVNIPKQPNNRLANLFSPDCASMQLQTATSTSSCSSASPNAKIMDFILHKILTFLRSNPHYTSRTIPEEQELWHTILKQSDITSILSDPMLLKKHYLSGQDRAFIRLKPKLEELENDFRPVLKHFGSFGSASDMDPYHMDEEEIEETPWQIIDTPEYGSAEAIQMAKLNAGITGGVRLILLPTYPTIPRNTRTAQISPKEVLNRTIRHLLSPLAVDLTFDTREEVFMKPVVAVGPIILEWDSTVGLCIPRYASQLSRLLLSENCIFFNEEIELNEETLDVISNIVCAWNSNKAAIFTSQQRASSPNAHNSIRSIRKSSVNSSPNCDMILENKERGNDCSSIYFVSEILKALSITGKGKTSDINELFLSEKETCFQMLLNNHLQNSLDNNQLKMFDGADSFPLYFPVYSDFREHFGIAQNLALIQFKTHTELDDFVMSLLSLDSNLKEKFPLVWSILKCMDRCFWVGHLHDNEDGRFLPSHVCPFGDPTKG